MSRNKFRYRLSAFWLAVLACGAGGCSNAVEERVAEKKTPIEKNAVAEKKAVKQSDATEDPVAEFHPQVVLTAAGEPIDVSEYGYSAPCWADVDGDGKKDLLVGEFQKGHITVYSGVEGIEKLGAGELLKAGDEVATIPGVG